MNYIPHPTGKEMPNRKMRKSQRNTVWLKNSKIKKLQYKQRRAEKKQLESEQ